MSGAMARTSNEEGLLLGMVGSLVVMAVAIALTSARGPLGPTNVALILCIVVVGFASLGGRYSGVVTGFVGALSFDFWHVRPYGTLQIDRARDLESVALLMVIGAIVGELSLLRQRSRTDRTMTVTLLDDLLRVTHLVAAAAPFDDIWHDVRTILVKVMSLDECRLEVPAPERDDLPRMDEPGLGSRHLLGRFVGRGFALPRGGAVITVRHDGAPLGRVVVVPRTGEGVTADERRVGVALVEQLGIALARDGTGRRAPDRGD